MKPLILITALVLSFTISSQTKKLRVESNHSTVGFSISIAGFTKVTGKFTDYKLNMDWNDQDLAACKISTIIQAASINTGIPDRDTHLQSADFFNVEEFPTINFESETIEKLDDKNYNAIGKFTMHGVTKDFVLPITIVKVDGNTIGITSRTTLNRQDYGVGSEFKHSSMPDFLSDTINVEIDFWTKKRKE